MSWPAHVCTVTLGVKCNSLTDNEKFHWTPTFTPEDGGCTSLWDVGICLQVRTASQLTRATLTSSSPLGNSDLMSGHGVGICFCYGVAVMSASVRTCIALRYGLHWPSFADQAEGHFLLDFFLVNFIPADEHYTGISGSSAVGRAYTNWRADRARKDFWVARNK
jgi:hypothetical protein